MSKRQAAQDRSPHSDRIVLSFDVGGTLTDFAVVNLNTGEVIQRHKVPTSPHAPAVGVLRGWSELVGSRTFAPPDVGLAVHSTTLVTNSIIERKGARTALLATMGFKDVLESGREQMYDIYDLFAPPPDPLIPRPLRLEIDERVVATGELLLEPSREPPEAIADNVMSISTDGGYGDPAYHSRAAAERDLAYGYTTRTVD